MCKLHYVCKEKREIHHFLESEIERKPVFNSVHGTAKYLALLPTASS